MEYGVGRRGYRDAGSSSRFASNLGSTGKQEFVAGDDPVLFRERARNPTALHVRPTEDERFDMTHSSTQVRVFAGLRRISRLGARSLTALFTALLAAVLLFASPEIGIAGAIGGVVVGGISAILMRPHS